MRNSDGNFVYAGNFDDDGGNVNRNEPRNSNSIIGCAFSEVISKEKSQGFSFVVDLFSSSHLSDLIQPPVILPISMILFSISIYCPSDIAFIRFASLTRIFSCTKSLSSFSSIKILELPFFLLAKRRYSSIFSAVCSMREPIPYESRLGNCLSDVCIAMYNSLQL